MQHRERQVVRGLIVDPDSRILLVKIVLPDRVFWITPGGGIENQEDAYAALHRELHEEIGFGGWKIGPEVWMRSHTFDFEGETLTQHERFYWVPTEWFKPPSEMADVYERRVFGGFRWWTIDELSVSNEQFAPRQLVKYFGDILVNGLPETSINVGI